jgi:hypothetical protein
VAINGDARAYPVKILNWHEIVNHTVGGSKISLTYCPLAGSGINFDADRIAFGNTGALYNNNMVMYDRTTQSFWSQMGSGSIAGSREGERLELLPVFQSTWAAWKALFPGTTVLSTSTGYGRDYRVDNFIQGGYTTNSAIFFPQGPAVDPKFHPKEMVLGLLGDEAAKAYPFAKMGTQKVINDTFDDGPIVVFYQKSAQLALAYNRQVDGRVLTFEIAE